MIDIFFKVSNYLVFCQNFKDQCSTVEELRGQPVGLDIITYQRSSAWALKCPLVLKIMLQMLIALIDHCM